MKKKLSMFLAAATVLSLILTGCGGGSRASTTAAPAAPAATEAASEEKTEAPAAEQATEAPAAEEGDKVLKVGVLCCLTGTGAKAGTAYKEATAMVFEDNDFMVDGYKIEPVYVDVTDDPERGALALEQAIVKDGVDVVFQGWFTTICIACMDVCSKYEIPYYFNNGAGNGIDEKWASDPEYYSYYVGKGFANTDFIATEYLDCINDAIDDNRWAPANRIATIFGSDTEWGRSVGKSFVDTFTEGGWEIANEEYFADTTTDFYGILSKMKDSGASLVAGTISNPSAAAAMLKQAKEMGLDALIIMDSLSENGEWYELCGDAANGVLDCRQSFYNEAGQEFAKRWKERMGYAAAPSCEGTAYDHALNFINACHEIYKVYGKLDTESFYKFATDYIQTGEYEFTGGVTQKCFKWGPDVNPNPIVGEDYFYLSVMEFNDGEVTTLWPENRQQAKFTKE